MNTIRWRSLSGKRIEVPEDAEVSQVSRDFLAALNVRRLGGVPMFGGARVDKERRRAHNRMAKASRRANRGRR